MNTLQTIETIIARHERFSSSYFWAPPGNASGRRQMEAQNSASLVVDLAGDHYEISQSVSCSCRNVYYRLSVSRNGQKKDVRALRALARDLARDLAATETN